MPDPHAVLRAVLGKMTLFEVLTVPEPADEAAPRAKAAGAMGSGWGGRTSQGVVGRTPGVGGGYGDVSLGQQATMMPTTSIICGPIQRSSSPAVGAPSARSHDAFAGQDELRYTGFTPNEPVGCH